MNTFVSAHCSNMFSGTSCRNTLEYQMVYLVYFANTPYSSLIDSIGKDSYPPSTWVDIGVTQLFQVFLNCS